MKREDPNTRINKGDTLSMSQERPYKIMHQFTLSDTLESLFLAGRTYLENTISEICHASLWGNDGRQRCVFLVHELKNEIGIRDFPDLSILRYESGIFGPIAETRFDRVISADSFVSIGRPAVLRFLVEQGVKSVGLVSIESVPDYSSYLVLVSRAAVATEMEQLLPEIKAAFSIFMHAYSRIRSKAVELQLQTIIQSKLTRSGLEFLKGACEGIAKTFCASTFSVWINEGNEVVPKYFSDPHEGEKYRLGEGLTGYTAQSGEPIYLHTVSDAQRFYKVKWLGKVSDFHSRPPDPLDHIMIIPVKYPIRPGKASTTNGVIRFVGEKSIPSFWPIDFSRACEIGEALSVLLYQESLLLAQEQTTSIHTTLINLMQQTTPSVSLDETFLIFLDEIQHWPGVKNVTIIEADDTGNMNYQGCGFLQPHHLKQLKDSNLLARTEKFELSNCILFYPICTRGHLAAFLIAQLDPSQPEPTSAWLEMVALILGYMQLIGHFLLETEKLRNENEERQLQALAGTVYRLYAHEALNGVKAIESWIDNSKRGTANYDKLTGRLNEIRDNIVELLDSTSFVRLKRRVCVFNVELEGILNKLGFRHLRKMGNCELRLNLAGHKHQKVEIDPNILIPILNNLVLNAREQYEINHKKGPIEISIIDRKIGDRLYIGVSVQDYAIGIEERNKESIFKSGWTTKEGGQGLGLWIVKKLVDASEGKVLVDSTLGHFTLFEIVFPIIEED